MKKLLFILILLFPLASNAKWIKVIGEPAIYLDPPSIRESNGYIYFWLIFNTPANSSFKSSKVLWQGDCKTPKKKKELESFHYKSEMAEGQSFEGIADPDWDYLDPNTKGGVIIEKACWANNFYKKHY